MKDLGTDRCDNTDMKATGSTKSSVIAYSERSYDTSPSLSSNGKRCFEDTEHQKRPPLQITKQRQAVVLNAILDSPTTLLPMQGIGRPTMLSRIVPAKSCRRSSKSRRQHGGDSVCSDLADCQKENIDNNSVVMSNIVIDPSSPNSWSKGGLMYPPSPLPMSVTSLYRKDPPNSLSKNNTPSGGRNRLVSPNTASVASALSLLSRLPFHHR